MTGPQTPDDGQGGAAPAPLLVLTCGSAKADHPRPAAELYTGALFRAARCAAEADGRPWLICSSAHGLVDPRQLLDPYDQALADTPADIARLGQLIVTQRHLIAVSGASAGVEAWAPRRYVQALCLAGIHVRHAPLAGLGIGEQIGWLTRHARRASPTPAASRRSGPAAAEHTRSTPPPARGRSAR